jgi:hypothetical protein
MTQCLEFAVLHIQDIQGDLKGLLQVEQVEIIGTGQGHDRKKAEW